MLFVVLSLTNAVKAAETKTYHLVLENHVFFPSEVTIPANQKVKLIITNKDASPEEFDSFDLNRERVVFAGKQAKIFIGPLPPGKYEFFGEFHPESARGIVIVKEVTQ
ncbi:cupredoxin domain-containing protein [Alteromonas sediminis]|uniref:Cupredoxin domain-containing protein n=1 Tax=Alteromonas sediminis TaxID=2259342 RepID=A0A3N5XZQ2_9ALTE|nr:cupredoxin domain-containing protein [Alteromonas sediminis]RPJ66827.1 cupredoxin domain-containing protein [Alteromonas sediminis]